MQERVGQKSTYVDSYLDEATTASLLDFCDSLSYTVYQYQFDSGVALVRRAPKVEYYLSNNTGQRPLYRWGQTEEFWQAGYPMPANLCEIAARIAAETGETINHAIVIGYFDGTDQHAPPHRDKAQGVWVRSGVPTDMKREGSFFVLSLGYPRVFTLQNKYTKTPTTADIVWAKPLASGSMLKVSTVDNRALYHAVYPQAGAGVRFSIIFRTMATHVPVDVAAAALANSETHRFFRPKHPSAETCAESPQPKQPCRQHTSITPQSAQSTPVAAQSTGVQQLTPTQKRRIEANRQAALAKRAKKENRDMLHNAMHTPGV